MSTLVALGSLVLMALSILCFAAYRIKASKFEVDAMICKVVSLRITVLSGAGSPELSSREAGLES
jgi:hypothetical protein